MARAVSQQNVELARRGFEALSRGDMDTVAALFDRDVRWHGGDPDAPGACHNRDQALECIWQARARGRVGEIVDIVDAGDRVVVIMRPPGGADLRANLTTFRDGKVVEMVAYETPDDARAAAGL